MKPKTSSALQPKKRIFLVDDHDVVRLGITVLINNEPDLEVCGCAVSVAEALTEIRKLQPDAIIVDISLKNSNGLELLKVLQAENPELPALIMSMHHELIWAEVALRAGALGYLMKESSVDKLILAIRSVLAGKHYLSEAVTSRMLQGQFAPQAAPDKDRFHPLSDREMQVLNLLGQWKNAREIAEQLKLSVKTVEYYKQNLKQKLHLRTGAELNQFAVELSTHNQPHL